MKSGKELDELQESTTELYCKAVISVRERFTVSKTLEKHLETIMSYLNTYELMYRELNKIRDISTLAMKSDELNTIEGEMKVLYDTFWK